MPYDLSKLIVTNAAGEVKTREKAELLLPSAVTRITWGSEKVHTWGGNEGETYHYDPETHTAWNSRGLPCQGYRYALECLKDLRPQAHHHGKELAVSIADKETSDLALLAEELSPVVDVIEINGGCPNAYDKSGQIPIPSYHSEVLESILYAVSKKVRRRCKIALKISPIGDELFESLAHVINRSDVTEVIAVNTLPDQHGIKADGTDALSFRAPGSDEVRHLGGMSGEPLKEHGLRVVKGLRPLLHKRIRLTGCGGIFIGADAFEYLQAGAEGFAVGTAFFESSPRIFSDILEDVTVLNEPQVP